MAFLQVIEIHTSKFDELQALSDEYFAASEGKRTLERSLITLRPERPGSLPHPGVL